MEVCPPHSEHQQKHQHLLLLAFKDEGRAGVHHGRAADVCVFILLYLLFNLSQTTVSSINLQ